MIPVLPALGAVLLTVILLLVASAASAQEFDDVQDSGDTIFTEAQRNFAVAISVAEGFGQADVIPTLANNPGDLVLPHWTGETLGEGISVLAPDTLANPIPGGGWYSLLRQLRFIQNGKSHVYTLDMTISQMASKWTRTQIDDWANNVANSLGVPVTTTLREILT